MTSIVAGVQIQSTGSDGSHVYAIQALAEEGIICPNDRGVRLEAHHHAGAVATEIPDSGRDLSVSDRWETIKPALAFQITKGAALDAPRGDIVPG